MRRDDGPEHCASEKQLTEQQNRIQLLASAAIWPPGGSDVTVWKMAIKLVA